MHHLRTAAAIAFSLFVWFAGNATTGEDPVAFPVRSLLPKDETGASRFLEQHPEYDGRGITIAIFDTGVDPGAPGLQQTSDGKPKIIDVIDATGSGDVATTTIRKAAEGKLEGLTGRTLTVPPTWSNPTGDYRLGLKRGFELFPPELVGRLKGERRRNWDAAQRAREADLRRQQNEWDDAHKQPSPTEKKERDELQARLDVLTDALKEYDDPGPIYDCVVFQDGQTWRAVVDTDEDGDLAEETLLANYREAQQYASFGADAQLNFAVNLFDEGNLLSIVTVCGDHGTHVAGIASAFYLDRPDRNGIAPGAQIVSVKIGDTRLGGMETGIGLARGIKAVLDHGCDLINMSYGEETSVPNHGRLIDLFSEAINEHGVIFVASAGNSGPALSTVGAPGGTSSAMLGVGAYVSPEMAAVEYTIREELPGLPYTWTSRGPTFDGDFGVDLFAPGGAIAPVPGYTLQPSQRMNGTSMASPNACGGIALLLSGLKAEQIAWTPYNIRKAVQNTAQPVEGIDPAAQGPGLLQVDRAFEHLKEFASAPGEDLCYDVRIQGRETTRGIYLRESTDTLHASTFNVSVRPRFRRSDPKSAQLALELPVTLQATADWIDVGDYALLTSGGASFEVRVDPTELEPGVYFAEVQGRDPERPERGPLFRVPVTVTRTTPLEGEQPASLSGACELGPGESERLFVTVPEGAAWADLRLSIPKDDTPSPAVGRRRAFMVHALQIVPGQSFEESQFLDFLGLEPGGSSVHSFDVVPGRTLEVCLARYWSSLGETQLHYELTFRGLQPDAFDITLPGDGSAVPVDVTARIRRERCDPSGSLSTWRQLLRPAESTISVLTAERDLLPENEQLHELLLTYDVSQLEDSRVTLHIPDLEQMLYDAPVDALFWTLYDKHKRFIAADDMIANEITLHKGEYQLRLQLRHTDVAQLEVRKATLLAVDRPLAKALSINAYATRVAAAEKGAEFAARDLDPGEHAIIWWKGPVADDVPEECQPGDLLLGSIDYVATPEGEPGASARPSGFPLQFVVPPAAAAEEEPAEAKPVDEKKPTTTERLAKELLELQLEQLNGLKWPADQEVFDQLAAQIGQQHPGDRRVLVARLHVLDDDEREERLPEIVAAADAVIAAINREELARHFGTQIDEDEPEQTKARKELTAERDDLADALYRKGRALGYMELPEVVVKRPIADAAAHDAAFEGNFRELSRWVDTTADKYYLLQVRRDRRKGRQGLALELLNRHLATGSPNEEHFEKRRDMYGELGWDDWRDYEQRWMLIRFPAEYQP
jgi:tripeptidyl-peptidase-2